MKTCKIIVACFALLAAGCAVAPSTPTLTNAGSRQTSGAVPVTPPAISTAPPGNLQLAAVGRGAMARGARVRWGGTIVALRNEPGWTRLEVLEHGLDAGGQPRADSPSAGRFMVRAAIPYEPRIYAEGRLITVAGVLAGTAESSGPPSSSLPLVEASNIYLWGPSVAQDDQPLPRRPRRASTCCSLSELLQPLLQSVISIGVGYGSGWNHGYPAIGFGYAPYWNNDYYPGYGWFGSGLGIAIGLSSD